MVDCSLTDELELFLELTEGVWLFDGSSLIEKTEVGQSSQRHNELNTMTDAYIFTQLTVYLFVNALVDYRLDTHIFENIFNRPVERYAIFVVLH